MSESEAVEIVRDDDEESQLSSLDRLAESERDEVEGEFQESGSEGVSAEDLPIFECVSMALAAMSKVMDARFEALGVSGQALSKAEIDAIALPAAACIDKYAPAAGGVGIEGALVLSVAMVAFPRVMALSDARLRGLKDGNKAESSS